MMVHCLVESVTVPFGLGEGSPNATSGTALRGGGSDHDAAVMERRAVPRARVEDVAQALDGVPDVGIAEIQRGHPEAQQVRLAVVADDPPVDHVARVSG